METKIFRWGILGTAQIARKNWQAIRHSGNGIVAAVASRDLSRSRQFIAECQSSVPFAAEPRAVGSYEELISAPDIDGLYIPLPTGIRKDWIIRAAEAGKHVVCEKPCAINLADLMEMVAACRENGVQFMDGVMFMHSGRLPQARRVLDEGKMVGRISRINANFCFFAPEEFFTSNIRAHGALEPLGCVGDLGWYCVRFALWTMNWQRPREVTGRLLAATSPSSGGPSVPTSFSGELFFDGGVSAGFYCSFHSAFQQDATISGDLGQLHVPDFVLPFFGSETAFATRSPYFSMVSCDSNMEPHSRRWAVPEYSNSHPSAQETKLFRNFAAKVHSGCLSEEWPAMALQTQEVLERCLESARSESRIVTLAPA